MIERRKAITGPGGEIAYYQRRSEYRGDRRNPRKHCQTSTWVLHQVDSIVPLAWISNVYPCQMVEHIYDGNYIWERLSCIQ